MNTRRVIWSPIITFIVGLTLLSCRTEFEHCSASPFPCNDSIVRFAVIGDWGMWGSEDQRAVANSLASVGDACPYDFIVSTGDNIYSDGVSSIDDPLWQSCFEQVYSHPSLQCPWYAVLGNHDYRGNPLAEIEYSSISSRWKMPSKHFSHIESRQDFSLELFFMDSNPFQDDIVGTPAHPALLASDTLEQKQWILEALAQTTAKWKMVVGHHPMYTCGMRKQLPQYMRDFELTFDSLGVQAYLCGHEHDLQVHRPPSGLCCLVSGSGAQARPIQTPFDFTSFARSELGFMVIEVSENLAHILVYNQHGQVLHSEEVLP
jgi:tartrate-resistant acid phosphatase type 5